MARRKPRGLWTWLVVAITGAATVWGFYLVATRDPRRTVERRERFGLPAALAERFRLGADVDAGADRPPGAPPEIHAVSPRLVSNGTSYPLLVFGVGFRPGDTVVASGPEPDANRLLPTDFVDGGHLTARLPPALPLPTQQTFGTVRLSVRRADGTTSPAAYALRVVNDATFPDPRAIATDREGNRVFVASTSTDAVWWIDAPRGERPTAPRPIAVGDGPRALDRWTDPQGRDWLVVVHGLEPTLWLLPMDHPDAAPRVLTVDGFALEDVVVTAPRRGQAIAWVTSRGTDAVHAIRLEDGAEVARHPVGVDPGPLAVGRRRDGGAVVMTGNAGSDDVSLVSGASGDAATSARIGAGPGARILGGGTEAYARWVMGSKAPRALAARDAPRQARATFFAASIGPNVGPNPDRMEVGMNGGVTVYPADGPPTHVALREGVPVDLALSDDDVLFVADVARGRVVALDARALASGRPAAMRSAELAAVAIDPPPGTPRLRPEGTVGHAERAPPALHSGPWALALVGGGRRLLVLGRFTGHVTEIDVDDARRGRLAVRRSYPVVPLRSQRQRRLGQVAFYTDVGGTRMSCDTCHVDGREGGLFFTKDRPMHVYRAPSLLSIAESPPYFTPAKIPSLEATSEVVLGRNRFHDPDPTPREVAALALWQAALVAPPSPHRGPRGELPEALRLPDGRTGSAVAGLAVFEGAGGCAECHAAPALTTDGDEATRGRFHAVGTPTTLPLRPELQDDDPYPLPPPSLVGLWDRYPLLHSGAGGYGVVGDRIEATHPDAIDRVLELSVRAGDAHGEVPSPAARRDLAAFLRAM